MKNNLWKTVIDIVITILTAIATTITTTSCTVGFWWHWHSRTCPACNGS